MTNQTVTSRSRQIGIIISGSLAGFMVLLDSNIVNISLPEIASYFNISTAEVVQITLVYLLMISSTLIIFGKLADKYGVKRIFVTGFTIFTVSSLLCGLATTFPLLLGARILQSLGGSMLYATAITLITRFIPSNRRGWAFGIFSPVSSLGMLIGNPLGGLITGMLDWHWIFLVNIPIGLLAILFAIRIIPSDKPEPKTTAGHFRFDLLGSLLSFAGLAALVFFLSKGQEMGWTSTITITGLLSSALLLAIFVLWERKVKDPILDLSIFSSRSFSFAILASIAGFGLMSGSNVLLPFYIINGLHIDVTHAGFITMTFAVVFSISTPVTGRLSDRVSKVGLTNFGMFLGAGSCIAFALLLPQLHLGILFGFMVLLGLSYAFFITPNNNLVMSLAPVGKQAISSSVFKLGTNLGQMFGLIMMEMIFTMSISQPAGSKEFALKTIPITELTNSFTWAYAGGAMLCLLAVLFSLFIRKKDTKIKEPEETAFLY
ncbi:MAG: MFS transporter [Bacteroidia bacterium]|nr:MFS transporter [Bacteroidia bacterium]